MNETLLDRALSWLRVAKTNFTLAPQDDNFLNVAGFYLQQATELGLKYLIELEGERAPQTHDIELLCKRVPEDAEYLVRYLKRYADTLSKWESKSRYVTNYRADKDQLEELFPVVTKFLESITEYVGDITLPVIFSLSERDKGIIWQAIPQLYDLSMVVKKMKSLQIIIQHIKNYLKV